MILQSFQCRPAFIVSREWSYSSTHSALPPPSSLESHYSAAGPPVSWRRILVGNYFRFRFGSKQRDSQMTSERYFPASTGANLVAKTGAGQQRRVMLRWNTNTKAQPQGPHQRRKMWQSRDDDRSDSHVHFRIGVPSFRIFNIIPYFL